MPTYEFNCEHHGDFEKRMRMSEYTGTEPCPECGSSADRVLRTPGAFNLPGDSWATKNGRIAGQMQKKTARMKVKTEMQKRDAPPVTLLPNVEGERTETWAEAKRLAVSQGKRGDSYDANIRSEKARTQKIEVTQ